MSQYHPWVARSGASNTLEIKQIQWDSAQGAFRGVAGSFGNLDRTNDIIERGAFAKTLQQATERKARTGNPYLWPLLLMHEVSKPCGGVMSAKETARGLEITGQLDLDSDLGRRVFAGVKAGYISELSIGYSVVKSRRDKQGVRHLLEINLAEISLITQGFAASDQAMIEAASVKSANPRDEAAERAALRLRQDMRAWRQANPPRAGPAPDPDWEPEPDPTFPQRASYVSDSRYREAIADWRAQHYAASMPSAHDANQAAFGRAVADQQAARLSAGQATVSERLAAAPRDPAFERERRRIERAVHERLRALDEEHA